VNANIMFVCAQVVGLVNNVKQKRAHTIVLTTVHAMMMENVNVKLDTKVKVVIYAM
jgi:hypothetical protein